jgi:hypothetical protein
MEPPRPAPTLRDRARAVAAEATPVERDTPVDEAVQALANDLRSIPGIERFGTMRLAELDRTGPRPLRTLWRIARDSVDERTSELTIGDVIDRWGGGQSGGTGLGA